ncbi:MAG TPA: 23S rRNA (uracil(1939)-C(5))-methyltransferase RlmD [Elusimicrobiota bacterium]|nr:23S rRNA (uracil(1939)-C(5))-methyltransferase RlmD [Elusimicrobiota bacterium]
MNNTDPDTLVPRLCRHFGACGGCLSQDVPYDIQLRQKEDGFRTLMDGLPLGAIHPILPSPDVFFYRNKMDFAFGWEKGQLCLGLRRRNRFNWIVDLEECLLLSPETGLLLNGVRRWAHRSGLTPYHLKAHQGLLRYLSVREGKNTGQRMVHLITTSEPMDEAGFVDAVQSSGFPASTILHSVYDGLSDTAAATAQTPLTGEGAIEERIGPCRLRVPPGSFLQTNTHGAETLYGVARDALGPSVKTLVDLFCGAGSIGLFCAERCERILGYEIDPVSVDCARSNARLNNATQADYVLLDAGTLKDQPGIVEVVEATGTAVVADPPRPGLGRPLRQFLSEHPAERLIYVSCNPVSLKDDLLELTKSYSIDWIRPVDMFPHTPHLETVTLLRKK